MNNTEQTHKTVGGFTLIEMLVVITIISIIAAMLLPGLNATVNLARNTLCTNNLKQNGLTVMFYANDYNGTFPAISRTNKLVHTLLGGSQWSTELYVSDKQIWQCPSDERNHAIRNTDSAIFTDLSHVYWATSGNGKVVLSYQWNAFAGACYDMGTVSFYEPYRLAKAQSPSKDPIFFGASGRNEISSCSTQFYYELPQFIWRNQISRNQEPRHQELWHNILAADGHVGSLNYYGTGTGSKGITSIELYDGWNIKKLSNKPSSTPANGSYR